MAEVTWRVVNWKFLEDGSGKKWVEVYGNSSLQKPVSEDFSAGSVAVETNTGKAFLFDETDQTWYPMGGDE